VLPQRVRARRHDVLKIAGVVARGGATLWVDELLEEEEVLGVGSL
jgi:hypothetical protein